MKRYIIHLKIEYYEAEKKEKKSSIKAGIQENMENALNTFKKEISPLIKDKLVSLPKEEYKGPSFSVGTYLDLNEDNLEKILGDLRALEIVDILEPEIYQGV